MLGAPSCDIAHTTYAFQVPAINQTNELWLFENGKWRGGDNC